MAHMPKLLCLPWFIQKIPRLDTAQGRNAVETWNIGIDLGKYRILIIAIVAEVSGLRGSRILFVGSAHRLRI